MKTIKIDDEVWETLKNAAVPFEDEPNDALRKLIGLSDLRLRSSPNGKNGGGADQGGSNRGSAPPHGGGARFDRTKVEEAIVQIIKGRGGETLVKDPITGFNIYEQVGGRLGISREVQQRLTPSGENAWRAEVGFARKNLEQRGVIAPTSESGRGVWKLK